MRWLATVPICLAFASALSLAAPPDSDGDSAIPEPYAAAVADLQQRTELSVAYLPVEVPFEDVLPARQPQPIPRGYHYVLTLPEATYYATTREVGPRHYALNLTTALVCQIALPCHIGSVTAEARVEETVPKPYYRARLLYDMSAPAALERQGHSPEPPTEVTLAGGVRGWFVPYSGKTLTLAESAVYWFEAGMVYGVSLKLGTQAQLVDLANSALANPVPLR